jgi:hypothetical protein
MDKPTSRHVSKPVSLLGIAGLRVRDVWEFAAERHVFVDTPRYREVCCECSGREQHPEIASRTALTERARREATRQVGQEGQAVVACQAGPTRTRALVVRGRGV